MNQITTLKNLERFLTITHHSRSFVLGSFSFRHWEGESPKRVRLIVNDQLKLQLRFADADCIIVW